MPAPRGAASGSNGAARPVGLVEHLAQQAVPKPVNTFLSISKYYTSADLLLRQADSYRKERNEEQLYVMLLRFASLVLETIPRHGNHNPKDPKFLQLRKVLMERLFSELEALKLSLKAKDPLLQPQAQSRNRPANAVQLGASNLPAINWEQSGAALPPPSQPQQLLVDDLLDIVQHGAGPSQLYSNNGGNGSYPGQQQQQQASQQGALVALPPAPVYQSKYATSGNNRHALFATASSSSTSTSSARPPGQGPEDGWGASTTSPYGNLNGQQQQQQSRTLIPKYPGLEAMQQLAISSMSQPSPGPALGPQEVGVITLSPQDVQGLPDTCGAPGHGSHGGGTAAQPALPAPPPPDAGSTGPREIVKRAELRDVHVSVGMMEEFLAYARSNTSRNVESCGILAGTLAADDSVFTITTLIVPKQEGTSDTVQALNEEEIYMVQAEAGLYPLGWIHTHPSQTCFLSSVDVHTHCGYQTMLDEAVAIVMAPTDRKQKCGIFRLSTPGGLQLVQRCGLRGFHAHPPTPTGQDLYELCGHVFLNPKLKHKVIDLR